MIKSQKKKEKLRREGSGDRVEDPRGKILSLEHMDVKNINIFHIWVSLRNPELNRY